MSKTIIQAKGLVKAYGEGGGKTYALHGVDMEVKENEFLVILGGSGSGKSTLLNMLGGMDRVDEGQIYFHGKDIAKATRRELTVYRRDSIGFVYQFFNLLNDLTVLQNVMIAPGASKHKQRALDILERMGLSDKIDKFPGQLSGGQQQRVAVARALNKECELLLCDEPTGALDASSGKAMLELLEELHNEGKTIVLVTHTREIAAMATRVIHMKDGKIIDEYTNEKPCKASTINW